MDKKTETVMTVITIVIVIALIIAFVTILMMFKNGQIDQDRMLIFGFFLSVSLTTAVIVYGALVLPGNSTKEQYMEYVKEREKNESTNDSEDSKKV